MIMVNLPEYIPNCRWRVGTKGSVNTGGQYSHQLQLQNWRNSLEWTQLPPIKINSMNTNKVNNKPFLPGNEYPEKNEDKIAGKIVTLLQNQMLRKYAKKGAKQLRQIHPKMNGCVKAEFIIERDLPDELRVGIFKEAKSFPA